MEIYKSINENSNIKAFEYGPNFIIIKYNDGVEFLYDHQKPGLDKVTKMIELAKKGQGLSDYLENSIKKNFAKIML